MANLTINGRKVTVDDSFLSLSPEDQEATVDEIASSFEAPAPAVSQGEDLLKSGASGVARGTADLLGLPGTLRDAMKSGGDWAMRKGYELATGAQPSPTGGAVERFFAGPTPEAKEMLGQDGPGIGSGAQFRDILSGATGGATEYKPQTTAGKYAGTVGEFIPGAAAFGGGTLANILRFGVLPGASSEAAGQMTEGSAIEPYARAGAALLSPALPAISRRAITPLPMSPDRRAAAAVLDREGVPLTAGQRTGNDRLRYAESELGGNAASRMYERQGEAFTDAAMRRAGGAGLANSENLAANQTRLGQGFEDVASRNTIRADPQIGQDLGQVLNRYGNLLETQQRPAINNTITDLVQRFQAGGGQMPGQMYQTIRSDLTKAVQNARGTTFGDALRGIRNALDDAMNRSISPEDAGTWRELRRQYGNQKTLEKAIASAGGEAAATGVISPARLRMAASGGNRGGYARGEGDYAELAKAGQAIMTQLPNSGTAARLSARNLTGALMTSGLGGALAGIPGALVGAAIPSAIGRALLSRPGRAYLGNQVAQPQPILDQRLAGIVAALLGQNGGGQSSLPSGR